MAKTTKNGKNVILETIISYNAKDDTVMITSKDPDLEGHPFHITLNKSTNTEKTLRKLLLDKKVIKPEKIGEDLPETIKHPETFNKNPYIFDIGVTGKNIAQCDASTDSNVLISGIPGSGKTIVAKSFLKHAEYYDTIWDYSIISPLLEGEYAEFNQSKISNPTKNIDELNKALDRIVEDIDNQIHDKENENFKKHILLFDYMDNILPSMIQERLIKNIDIEKIINATNKLNFIYNNARAAGYYIIYSTKNPSNVTGEIKALMGTRIAMGRTDEYMSSMSLGTSHATRIPEGLGKGYLRIYADGEFFQAYDN